MPKEPKNLNKLVMEAKNDSKVKNVLLEAYYHEACKWAEKYIRKILYTDLVKPTRGEIESLVYQAFEKTIQTIDITRTNNMSFKNYFYLMIKYQSYAELKTTLNCGVIQNFEGQKSQFKKEQQENENYEQDQMKRIEVDMFTDQIIKFLEEKQWEYAEIIRLKMKGYKNEEISQKLKMSGNTLKAKLQYIKKLLKDKFISFEGLFF